MSAQGFTRNYNDHSNDQGYQFEFICDHCGNGYRSSFQTSTMGLASSLLKAAGSLFGGLGQLGYGADHVKDALRGPAWDSAFQAAIQEIRPKFHQCTRCGKWVCPEVCWNQARGLCEECAPDIGEQAAAIQAQVAVEQAWEKARGSNQLGGMDLSQPVAVGQACAKCQSTLAAGAKFCASCGTPVQSAAQSRFCSQCGGNLAPGARFCAQCGKPSG